MNEDTNPAALRELQEDIYRRKVLRARELTVAQRLADVMECSDAGLRLMFSGVRMQQPDLSDQDTWSEVGARIQRVRRLRDYGYYQSVEARR